MRARSLGPEGAAQSSFALSGLALVLFLLTQGVALGFPIAAPLGRKSCIHHSAEVLRVRLFPLMRLRLRLRLLFGRLSHISFLADAVRSISTGSPLQLCVKIERANCVMHPMGGVPQLTRASLVQRVRESR